MEVHVVIYKQPQRDIITLLSTMEDSNYTNININMYLGTPYIHFITASNHSKY